MRTIEVFSTLGGCKKYETEVTIWGDLRNIIKSDFNLDNLKATESINKTSLESSEAKLPEGNFVLHLRPDKVDGNIDYSSLSFKELREIIKADDHLKFYLSNCITGKNYTQLSKQELIKFMQDYQNGMGENVVEDIPEDDEPIEYNEPIEEETRRYLPDKDILIDFFMEEFKSTREPTVILEQLLLFLYGTNSVVTHKQGIIKEYNQILRSIL
jgi:hypothetical protein